MAWKRSHPGGFRAPISGIMESIYNLDRGWGRAAKCTAINWLDVKREQRCDSYQVCSKMDSNVCMSSDNQCYDRRAHCCSWGAVFTYLGLSVASDCPCLSWPCWLHRIQTSESSQPLYPCLTFAPKLCLFHSVLCPSCICDSQWLRKRKLRSCSSDRKRELQRLV